jgi:hypothetical protein
MATSAFVEECFAKQGDKDAITATAEARGWSYASLGTPPQGGYVPSWLLEESLSSDASRWLSSGTPPGQTLLFLAAKRASSEVGLLNVKTCAVSTSEDVSDQAKEAIQARMPPSAEVPLGDHDARWSYYLDASGALKETRDSKSIVTEGWTAYEVSIESQAGGTVLLFRAIERSREQ